MLKLASSTALRYQLLSRFMIFFELDSELWSDGSAATKKFTKVKRTTRALVVIDFI